MEVVETLKNAKNIVGFTKTHSLYKIQYSSFEFWLAASFFAIFEGFLVSLRLKKYIQNCFFLYNSPAS